MTVEGSRSAARYHRGLCATYLNNFVRRKATIQRPSGWVSEKFCDRVDILSNLTCPNAPA